MNSFVAKHRPEINGVLECFDRLILRGHLPIAGTGYFVGWLTSKRIAFNLNRPQEGWWNFKDAAPWFAETLKAHARALAENRGRPYRHLPCAERMEETLASWRKRMPSPMTSYASTGRWKRAVPSACSTTRTVPSCTPTGASAWSSTSTGWIANSA